MDHSLHSKLVAITLIVIYISMVVIVHHLYRIKMIFGKFSQFDHHHPKKDSSALTKLYIDLIALFWFVSLPIHGILLCFKYLYYLPKGER